MLPREETDVLRNERRGENTFSEKILKEVRYPERGIERICCERGAEVVREDFLSNETRYATQQNSGGDEESGAARTVTAHVKRSACLSVSTLTARTRSSPCRESRGTTFSARS